MGSRREDTFYTKVRRAVGLLALLVGMMNIGTYTALGTQVPVPYYDEPWEPEVSVAAYLVLGMLVFAVMYIPVDPARRSNAK